MHQPYFRILPKSECAIVFIHGFIGTPDHFMQFLPLVPETWSIYNLLLDGHGGSVDAFSQTSMAKWQGQVKETLDLVKQNHQNIYLVGHSMGTLLEIQYTLLNPSQIKGLFLLAVPLHIHVTPLATYNALGTIFQWKDTNNLQLQAAKAMYSVNPDWRVWKYLKWIRRYFELFGLCKWTRRYVSQLQIPTICIQSKKDELVQFRSRDYLETDHIETIILPKSTHYYYPGNDKKQLFSSFEKFIQKMIALK